MTPTLRSVRNVKLVTIEKRTSRVDGMTVANPENEVRSAELLPAIGLEGAHGGVPQRKCDDCPEPRLGLRIHCAFRSSSHPDNVDDGQSVAHFVGVVAVIRHVAEAELATIIEAPALDRAVVE